ncbi:DedA family protein [Neobacillus drentensis]|uniref:DedA family protein n=1 Tax=Neobacillus drentensis TaxID=220684 RepID=UPI001F2E22F6|nr:DedA family protein [Neobacillus drentensis]ULT59651.1 DedA family protein [Neobacillus drentensis]
MEQHLDFVIEHFGYFGIILLLVGGIIGLPVPDEVLLAYVGYNVYQNKLSYIFSLFSAFAGSIGGISLSYFIGYKFGLPLIKKYGTKIHITEEKINRTQKLFLKIGPILLLIGYFIPGVRHLTAYVAALNKYPFRKFVIFSYIGAVIWSFTFITLGTKLGENWNLVGSYVSKYSFYLILISLLLLVVVLSFWKKRQRFIKKK